MFSAPAGIGSNRFVTVPLILFNIAKTFSNQIVKKLLKITEIIFRFSSCLHASSNKNRHFAENFRKFTKNFNWKLYA